MHHCVCTGAAHHLRGRKTTKRNEKKIKKKTGFVRSGIRTHALYRGPEVSFTLLTKEQSYHLESGALDHSAILTTLFSLLGKHGRIWISHSFITKSISSHLGIEPRTFGLEVQRAILCANGTRHTLSLPTCITLSLLYNIRTKKTRTAPCGGKNS